MRYIIRALGIKKAETRFTRMGEAAINAEPAMETVAYLMMVAIRKNFESQGRRGGGSWRQLSAEWLARKTRMAWDPRIGYSQHFLVNAFTMPEAPHQILDIQPHSVNLSSDLPYATTQQRHRPFAYFTKGDTIEMREAVRTYLIDAWRAAV